ncbi:tetratricopeptide repeat protein [Pontiellaceae bacterium B12219]|nr:tetratricopeptide repeat protein [Pontiellaceae bacterium B12219]
MAEVELADAPSGVRTYYDKGIAALERNNLDYAMDMFAAALQVEPRLLQVRKLLRAAAVKNAKLKPPGKLALARTIGDFMKASAAVKKNPMLAIELSEKLLRIDPLNLKFAKLQCSAATAAELPEIAIQCLEILKANCPPSLAILAPLAELYQNTEQFDAEYACREQIVLLSPTDTAALKAMKDSAARLTMGKAGWQKAESFRDVIRSEENSAATQSGELETLKERAKTNPADINGWLALADYYLKNRLFEDAIQTLEKARNESGTADPRLTQKLLTAKERQLTFRLAAAEDEQNDAEISNLREKLSNMRIEHAAHRVERYPNDLQLKFEFGKLLLEANRLTEAVQQFQQAQKNPQRRVRSLIYLSSAFEQKGQLKIAEDQLTSALSELPTMDNTRKEVLYRLGMLCEKSGNNEQAKRYLHEIYACDIGYRDVADRIEKPADQ